MSGTLFLGWWTSQKIPGFSQGAYMGLYAGLGSAQALLIVSALCETSLMTSSTFSVLQHFINLVRIRHLLVIPLH